MIVVPLSLADANALVSAWHRHSKPVRGHRFSIGAHDGDHLVGAAIVGRPRARALPASEVVEVLRLVTDGTPNACSFLYGASARAARALGYRLAITYTRAWRDPKCESCRVGAHCYGIDPLCLCECPSLAPPPRPRTLAEANVLVATEPGTSLRAAGWTREALVRGRSWLAPGDERDQASLLEHIDVTPLDDKVRWSCDLARRSS